MRAGISLFAACIALAVGASSAMAVPPLRDVGPATKDAASGRTLLAASATTLTYDASADHVRVIDGQLHEIASVRTPAGCAFGDYGGGSLLWYCTAAATATATGGFSGVVYDVGTRTTAQLPVAAGPHDALGGSPTWWTIGTHWLGVAYIANGPQSYAYVNRTTGQVVTYAKVSADLRANPRATLDLDRADLAQPLCSPLRAQAPGGSVPTPFAYLRPYGATLSHSKAGTRLLVGHCGARRMTVLSRCAKGCGDPAIGDHAVAWLEGAGDLHPSSAHLRVRLLDRSRTWSWSVTLPRRFSGSDQDPLVAVIGRRAFVLVAGKLQSVQLPAVKR
jgi:hypothetical protein